MSTLLLATAFGLMLLSVFIKSAFLKIALCVNLVGILLHPTFQNTWIQAVASVLIVWSIINAFLNFTNSIGD